MEELAENRCRVCDQVVSGSGSCSNYWCRREDERYFEYIYAISMHTGVLKDALRAYKYENAKGWAKIFGRVLVGYLDANRCEFELYDHIIPSPTYVGGRRRWDHIDEIVRYAEIEADESWPFDRSGLIVKRGDTESLVGKNLAERRQMAEQELRPLLSVPRPEAVKNSHVLVFDDVFTEGSTLREVARALIQAGAASVAQVTLARQPWSA